MNRRSCILMVGMIAMAAIGASVFVSAVGIAKNRGFSDHIVQVLFAGSIVCMSIAVFVLCAMSVYGAQGEDNGRLKFYLTARFLHPGVDVAPIAGKAWLESPYMAIIADGSSHDIDVESYAINVGRRIAIEVPRNSVGLGIRFLSKATEGYFKTVVREALTTNVDADSGEEMTKKSIGTITTEGLRGIANIVVREQKIFVSVGVNFKDSPVEHIMHTMSMPEQLGTGEGIVFFKWYCFCNIGMSKSRASYMRFKYRPSTVDSREIFNRFPGAYVAIRDYRDVLQGVIDYSKEAWKKLRPGENCHNVEGYLSSREVLFLEALLDGAKSYTLKEEDRECAEKSLTEVLVTLYVILASNSKGVNFDNEQLKLWIKSLMSDGSSEIVVGMYVAMSSIGGSRFSGKLIRRVYNEVCDEEEALGNMQDHMESLLLLCSDEITFQDMMSMQQRKGLEFLVCCEVFIPYFKATKTYKIMVKDFSYRSMLRTVKKNVSRLDVLNDNVSGDEDVVSVLNFHEGIFVPSVVTEMEDFMCSNRKRMQDRLSNISVLEDACLVKNWKDSSILKFFVQLDLWLCNLKEVGYLRGERLLKRDNCTPRALLKRHFNSFWRYLGLDFIMLDDQVTRAPPASVLREKVGVDFCVSATCGRFRLGGSILHNVELEDVSSEIGEAVHVV